MTTRAAISTGREVLTKWLAAKPVFCAKPTSGGYPVAGGWMALCDEHLDEHSRFSYSLEDIQSGLADRMIANGSRG